MRADHIVGAAHQGVAGDHTDQGVLRVAEVPGGPVEPRNAGVGARDVVVRAHAAVDAVQVGGGGVPEEHQLLAFRGLRREVRASVRQGRLSPLGRSVAAHVCGDALRPIRGRHASSV